MTPALGAAAEARFGPVRRASPVAGGSVNQGVRVEAADGVLFLKHNREAPPGLFAAEARGLDALRASAPPTSSGTCSCT